MPSHPRDSRRPRPEPDPLRRFYTRPAVGEALARLMGVPPGGRLLDLASGGGALGAAAVAAFAPRALVAVDLDPDAAAVPLGLPVRRVLADALDPDLPAILGEAGFDAVLCNPPYRPLPWDPRYPGLFEAAGLPGALGTRRQASADAVLAAQCLRLCRPGGLVGLIVPDGLVSGRRSRPFREALLARHAVLRVAQLPPSSFGDTEARAHLIVIVRDAGPGGPVPVHALRAGDPGPAILVEPGRAVLRLDHAHHAASWDGAALRDLGASVARGSLEAPAATGLGLPVFHTGDFPSDGDRRSHALPDFPEAPPGRALVTARAGDILVARLDRRLHRKVCGIASGGAVLTAAVLRLRVPQACRDDVLAALLSPEGEARLAATARGTGTRMMGQADLMAMPLPL